MMGSVTSRIEKIRQPYGGYIRPSSFNVEKLDDGKKLNEKENIHGILVGLAVDYLTRWFSGETVGDAFSTSFRGALAAERILKNNASDEAFALAEHFYEYEPDEPASYDIVIICACKLASFDVWYRNPLRAPLSKYHTDIMPDDATIENIKILVERSLAFVKKYGKIVKRGFTFEPVHAKSEDYAKMMKSREGSFGGYTPTVSSGDGDFLTKDTLWDMKVSSAEPTSKNTLQLLMYWIMGQHSRQKIYKSIDKIGIFNPRLNKVYLLNVKKIPEEIIKTIETEVICY